jgi:hypothetical protein
MTRKHYVEVAAILAGERAVYASKPDAVRVLDNVTHSLADVFKRDNSRFDRQRFYDAAGLDRAA